MFEFICHRHFPLNGHKWSVRHGKEGRKDGGGYNQKRTGWQTDLKERGTEICSENMSQKPQKRAIFEVFTTYLPVPYFSNVQTARKRNISWNNGKISPNRTSFSALKIILPILLCSRWDILQNAPNKGSLNHPYFWVSSTGNNLFSNGGWSDLFT